MSIKKIIIIQKDDNKSFKWAESNENSDIEILAQPGSPIMAPLFLLKIIIHYGLPAGYVVRYLNDYASFPKTLLRLFSEMTLVTFCYLARIKLFWICHNVDSESSVHYPSISKFRRWILVSVAKKIFVTDPLLIPYAQKHFPTHEHKVQGINFGEIKPDKRADEDKQKHAIDFIKKKKQEALEKGHKPFVLYCAGAPAEKSLHFDYLEELMTAGKRSGYLIVAIVAGDFSLTKRGKELLKRYRKNSDICVFECFTCFSPVFIGKYIDCYWRGYGDLSVPFTVYEAATLYKPILALNSGFLPEMIEKYKLGAVVESSFSGLGDALSSMSAVNRVEDYKKFLSEHQWSMLSQKLKEAI